MGLSNFREVKGQCAIKKFSVLWNSMIHPLLTMTIFGLIWYQGESNAGEKSSNYSCTFPAMISSWRQNWHKQSLNTTKSQLPFGFVQVSITRGIVRIWSFPGPYFFLFGLNTER